MQGVRKWFRHVWLNMTECKGNGDLEGSGFGVSALCRAAAFEKVPGPVVLGLMPLSLAKIKSALEMNNIRGGRVTCYMDEIQLLRSFGERQVLLSAGWEVADATCWTT
jgi:hypothetical protein